ncbi:MAG: NUDIX hydrolase [Patescibacteria group bacterium]|nr:NUDIX hydrolase [Patescibacteria group bacterium]MDE2014985.1 NUDIX hydrolase [Patescibacteria group bacterium]MDE2226414.1 NUDIX hydrolase [Patescibacteria group bacterium]
MSEENIGKSIGAIIRNEQGEYLTQYRLRHPLGLALPAGHVDPGEGPEEALKRELIEETGLTVTSAKLVLNDTFPNPCPKKGHTAHEWWVYEVVVAGQTELKEPDKHKFLKFMSPSEMKLFVLSGECDPAWFQYIFPALKIVI